MRQSLREQIPEPELTLTSKGLEKYPTYVIESSDFAGVKVISSNFEHGQDAFVVRGGAICVCDGTSSQGKSGLISQFVAEKMTEKIVSSEFISDESVYADLAEEIKLFSESSEYKDFDGTINRATKPGEENAGYTTFIALKPNKDEKVISWTSVGDSPLLILDKVGDRWTFEFQNTQFAGLTDEDFASKRFYDQMNNPLTSGIGIDSAGNTQTYAINDSMEIGRIQFKEGRVVIAATDFLTKIMADSPEVMEARLKEIKPGIFTNKTEYEELKRKRNELLAKKNPFFGEKFRPELLFNGGLSNEQIAEFLRCRDDMTAVCINMDEMFNQ